MKRWIFWLLASVIVIADRISKFYVVQGEFVRNYGLLFGLLEIPTFRWLFVMVIFLILVFFLFTVARRDVQKNSSLHLGLWLMIAGLIGNLADRVYFGFVVDFIRLYTWTTFNIADISIFIGAFIVFVHLIIKGGQANEQEVKEK